MTWMEKNKAFVEKNKNNIEAICMLAFEDGYATAKNEPPRALGGGEAGAAHPVLGDSRRAVERLLAKILDNKYEPDKIMCIIERAARMQVDDLIRKYRDSLDKREPGDFA